MGENMQLWNTFNRPPPEALNTIKGGRLKGMTDIKPQWRYQVMTDQLGPIGEGWYYEPVKEWTEPGPDGQVFCFVSITLYTIKDGLKSQPIYGIGGSMLIEKEWNKDQGCHVLHANDEAYKMATTDALSTAMGKLGVAADIYAGLWDGSKYRDKPVGTGNTSQSQSVDTGDHYCPVHKTNFFMRGKMKDFAHPYEENGTTKWCNEADMIARQNESDPNDLQACDNCKVTAPLHSSGGIMVCDECDPPEIDWDTLQGK